MPKLRESTGPGAGEPAGSQPALPPAACKGPLPAPSCVALGKSLPLSEPVSLLQDGGVVAGIPQSSLQVPQPEPEWAPGTRAGRLRWHSGGLTGTKESSAEVPPTQVSVPGSCPRLCTRVKGAWVATSCDLGKDTRKAGFPEHPLCAGHHAMHARNATSLSPQSCPVRHHYSCGG